MPRKRRQNSVAVERGIWSGAVIEQKRMPPSPLISTLVPMCSHVADTPAAAVHRKVAPRHDDEGILEMNIVLIHGAGVDGSCWSGVIQRLQTDGYRVTAPQFPLTALADDVARLRQVLDFQDGPTIVAGHSYGGQVMTALERMPRTSPASSTSPRSGLTRVNRWAGCCRRDR